MWQPIGNASHTKIPSCIFSVWLGLFWCKREKLSRFLMWEITGSTSNYWYQPNASNNKHVSFEMDGHFRVITCNWICMGRIRARAFPNSFPKTFPHWFIYRFTSTHVSIKMENKRKHGVEVHALSIHSAERFFLSFDIFPLFIPPFPSVCLMYTRVASIDLRNRF